MTTVADGRPPAGGLAEKDVAEAVVQETAQLASEVPQLVSLLDAPDAICRQNACAALSSIMAAGDELFSTVVSTEGVGQALVRNLKGRAREESSGAGAGAGTESVMRLNAATALGSMAQGEEGLRVVTAAGGVEALLEVLQSQPLDDKVSEAAADALCAIAAHDSQRQSLIDKGAVEALASLLQAPFLEVAQERLVSADGAVQALLNLARSQDPDTKMVATDLFSALGNSSKLRPALDQKIREARS
eukprot:jgi/Mesen1/2718/ME000168S01783